MHRQMWTDAEAAPNAARSPDAVMVAFISAIREL